MGHSERIALYYFFIPYFLFTIGYFLTMRVKHKDYYKLSRRFNGYKKLSQNIIAVIDSLSRTHMDELKESLKVMAEILEPSRLSKVKLLLFALDVLKRIYDTVELNPRDKRQVKDSIDFLNYLVEEIQRDESKLKDSAIRITTSAIELKEKLIERILDKFLQ